MENLIKNPGLKHLAENIFLYLDYEDIINCQIVSESWNGFLENPMFWLKKWTRRGLSKENKIGWIKQFDWQKTLKLNTYFMTVAVDCEAILWIFNEMFFSLTILMNFGMSYDYSMIM